MERLPLYIESLIFAAEQAVSSADMKAALEASFEVKLSQNDIDFAVDQLIEKYQSDQYSIEVIAVNGGYQFMSKSYYHHVIGNLLKIQSSKKLSKAALETLSIIAYKQPVTKSDVEGIRGVNCDYTIQKLLEKELCEIVGRDDGPGRPLLYGTSEKFMNYFGLKSIKELPKLSEIEKEEESIGSPAPIEEFSAVIQIKSEEE